MAVSPPGEGAPLLTEIESGSSPLLPASLPV